MSVGQAPASRPRHRRVRKLRLLRNGAVIRTYRVLVAATGITRIGRGHQSVGDRSMTTTMNRVNGIYEASWESADEWDRTSADPTALIYPRCYRPYTKPIRAMLPKPTISPVVDPRLHVRHVFARRRGGRDVELRLRLLSQGAGLSALSILWRLFDGDIVSPSWDISLERTTIPQHFDHLQRIVGCPMYDLGAVHDQSYGNAIACLKISARRRLLQRREPDE